MLLIQWFFWNKSPKMEFFLARILCMVQAGSQKNIYIFISYFFNSQIWLYQLMYDQYVCTATATTSQNWKNKNKTLCGVKKQETMQLAVHTYWSYDNEKNKESNESNKVRCSLASGEQCCYMYLQLHLCQCAQPQGKKHC
jgi:hypothetical protein